MLRSVYVLCNSVTQVEEDTVEVKVNRENVLLVNGMLSKIKKLEKYETIEKNRLYHVIQLTFKNPDKVQLRSY